MRVRVIPFAAVVVLLTLATGGSVWSTAQVGSSVFSTPGVIDRLAVDGNLVAASTRAIKGSCDRIVVWTAPGKKFMSFDTHLHCPQGGFPSYEYVTEVALGAGRVAWIEAIGGNELDLLLYAASVSGGPSTKLDSASNGYGAAGDIDGDYVGQLFGAGPFLAYNSWTLCSWVASGGTATPDCPVEGQVSRARLWRLSSADARTPLRSGAGSFRLAAVGGGRLALVSTPTFWPSGGSSETGRGFGSRTVTVLSASGRAVATVPPAAGNDPPRAVALSASTLVIERKAGLDLRNPAGGHLVRTIPLGAAAPLNLVGASSKIALLSGLHRLVAVRLSDGKKVELPLPAEATACACPIGARLNDTGLFYAYNVTATPAKGRVVFEPTAHLLARF